ncbi:MAG: hypothetical protein IPG81_00865 [Sandaracinaceae bacterium]|nr:hypothetical protein [Sandaracinaceae bacterium]
MRRPSAWSAASCAVWWTWSSSTTPPSTSSTGRATAWRAIRPSCAHVATHYDLQIKLYTLGVLRLLDVWDEAAYERVFGGHLYAFLRPMALGQPGVVFERPTFADVQRWERELLGMSFGGTPDSLAGGAR